MSIGNTKDIIIYMTEEFIIWLDWQGKEEQTYMFTNFLIYRRHSVSVWPKERAKCQINKRQ